MIYSYIDESQFEYEAQKDKYFPIIKGMTFIATRYWDYDGNSDIFPFKYILEIDEIIVSDSGRPKKIIIKAYPRNKFLRMFKFLTKTMSPCRPYFFYIFCVSSIDVNYYTLHEASVGVL